MFGGFKKRGRLILFAISNRFFQCISLALGLVAFATNSSAAVFELVVGPSAEIAESEQEGCNWLSVATCNITLDQLQKELAYTFWLAPNGELVEQIVVRFRPGIYRLQKPLQLNWGTGETADIRLVISGAGASTVLSGARPLAGWQRFNARIQVADVASFALPLDEPMPARGFGVPIRPVLTAVYQNDRALSVARWPNEGYARIERPADLAADEKHTFRVAGRTGLEWKNDVDLMAHGYWFHDWAAQQYPVVVGREGRLSIAGSGSPYGIRGGQRVLIENALSELDAPGEWYLQRSTGKLFAWLPDDRAPVEVAVAESIFNIENSRNIVIRDLAIEKVRGDAARVSDSDSVVFENVSIRHTGNRALVIDGGANNGIRNSLIEHNGEGAVFLNGGNREKLIPSGHFVENSTIRDFSRLSKTYRFAVEMDGVGQRVEGNRISEAPHTAILFRGNDHKILNNEIFDVVQETSDAGAIYVGRDFAARGTVIEGNFLHDIRAGNVKHEVKGIYLDDQASGITIRNNVFARVQQPVFIGGGRDNVVENNLFYESSPAVHLDARGLNWQRVSTLDPSNTLQKRLDAVPIASDLWKARFPNLAHIRSDDLGAPKYNTACGNVVVKGKAHSVAKEALGGIKLSDFVLGDEQVFDRQLPDSGRQSRADFGLKPEFRDRCERAAR